MTPYLLDTNAVSDLVINHPRMKANVASCAGDLITSAAVLGEIRYGLERLPVGKRRNEIEKRTDQTLAALGCEPVTAPIAIIYGSIRRGMERAGRSIGDNDLWIAATALALNAVVVSRDVDFRYVPGLIFEDWTV